MDNWIYILAPAVIVFAVICAVLFTLCLYVKAAVLLLLMLLTWILEQIRKMAWWMARKGTRRQRERLVGVDVDKRSGIKTTCIAREKDGVLIVEDMIQEEIRD